MPLIAMRAAPDAAPDVTPDAAAPPRRRRRRTLRRAAGSLLFTSILGAVLLGGVIGVYLTDLREREELNMMLQAGRQIATIVKAADAMLIDRSNEPGGLADILESRGGDPFPLSVADLVSGGYMAPMPEVLANGQRVVMRVAWHQMPAGFDDYTVVPNIYVMTEDRPGGRPMSRKMLNRMARGAVLGGLNPVLTQAVFAPDGAAAADIEPLRNRAEVVFGGVPVGAFWASLDFATVRDTAVMHRMVLPWSENLTQMHTDLSFGWVDGGVPFEPPTAVPDTCVANPGARDTAKLRCSLVGVRTINTDHLQIEQDAVMRRGADASALRVEQAMSVVGDNPDDPGGGDTEAMFVGGPASRPSTVGTSVFADGVRGVGDPSRPLRVIGRNNAVANTMVVRDAVVPPGNLQGSGTSVTIARWIEVPNGEVRAQDRSGVPSGTVSAEQPILVRRATATQRLAAQQVLAGTMTVTDHTVPSVMSANDARVTGPVDVNSVIATNGWVSNVEVTWFACSPSGHCPDPGNPDGPGGR